MKTDDIDVGCAERLVLELMAIPGPSCEERAVAEFIAAELRRFGVAASAIRFDRANRRTPRRGEVGNLVVRLPGTLRQPRRMFSAHMDTVPICVGCQPMKHDNTVKSALPDTGLGADNRAGCAVLLNTVAELLECDVPRPPLTFCWFVQEEIGLHGSRTATSSLWGKPQWAFNWDGGNPAKLTVGATGAYHIDIEIKGIASHAGVAPEGGVSAAAIAALAIADLQRSGWHGDIQKDRQRGTSNVGAIQGGGTTNVVMDKVTILAEARSHSSRFRRRILKQIEKAFRAAAKEVQTQHGKTGQVNIESRLVYDSFRLPIKSECIGIAEEAVKAIGCEPLHAVANGGLDANWITAHGVPTVSLGCGQRNQHMASESLQLDEFFDACRIGRRIAMGR